MVLDHTGSRRSGGARQSAPRPARPRAADPRLGRSRLRAHRPRRHQAHHYRGLNLETLRAVVETLVPEGASVGLAERVAAQVARLPRAADQAELTQLLGLMESRIANVALGEIGRASCRERV